MRESLEKKERIETKVRNGMVANTLAKSRLESETRALRMEADRSALNSSLCRFRV
jgi:hypothetical protein